MERTKAGKGVIKIIIVLVIAVLFGELAQSCNSAKKCGCGHDLNGVYSKRRHNW